MSDSTFKLLNHHFCARGAGLAGLTLVALVFVCVAPARALAQTAQAPAARPVVRPDSTDVGPRGEVPATPAPTRAPRRPHATQAATPAVAPVAPVAVTAPQKPAPPRNVVTVVHRLDGLKLLALIETKRKGKDKLVIDWLPSASGVYTNIVAGFVSEDGRTVIARLPSAEAEVVTPAPFGVSANSLLPGVGQWTPAPFTVIRGDGKRVEARFVGMDASTGLSLLESTEPLFTETPKPAVAGTPSVGQRLRLYAPAPRVAPPGAAPAAPVAPPQALAAGDMGDTEVLYLSMGATDGRLTEVKRAPTGELMQVKFYSGAFTPERSGAIAMTEAGDFVGIVGDSGDTESQIMPAKAINMAQARVLASLARRPRPWLGVRGEAATRFALQQMARNWPRDFGLPLLNNPQGVLLTEVAPGAPAALAGLKPGDIIARVGECEITSVEEFSKLLSEAGPGAKLDLTVWRAFEKMPLNLTVEMSDTREGKAAIEAMLANRPGAEDPYGVKVAGLTPRAAGGFKARGGLLVITVLDNSPAARAGLLPRDVIETIDGRALTLRQWRQLTSSEIGGPLTLGVVREGVRLSLTLERDQE